MEFEFAGPGWRRWRRRRRRAARAAGAAGPAAAARAAAAGGRRRPAAGCARGGGAARSRAALGRRGPAPTGAPADRRRVRRDRRQPPQTARSIGSKPTDRTAGTRHREAGVRPRRSSAHRRRRPPPPPPAPVAPPPAPAPAASSPRPATARRSSRRTERGAAGADLRRYSPSPFWQHHANTSWS